MAERSDQTLTPRRIVIDTDPGIDDAIAIVMALCSPDLDVVALTTVFGNMSQPVTTANTLGLLELAGRPDIPVAAGAARPLLRDYAGEVPFIHGPNGVGGVELPEASAALDPRPAAELLHQVAAERPGEVTLVAVGPLTNLALAVRLHPDLPELVDEVVVMGGNAYARGNASPAAEANILSDPEAADIVFGEDWPLTMVGLDVTVPVVLTGADIEAVGAVDHPAHRALARAVGSYREYFGTMYDDHDGICPHDATALAALLRPDLFETEHRPVRVETQGMARGRTWLASGIEFHDAAPWAGRPEVSVCTGVDASAVAALIRDRLVEGRPARPRSGRPLA